MPVSVARPAGPGPANWPAGDRVTVVGRVRRRFYRVAKVISSRTEVVAEQIVQHSPPAGGPEPSSEQVRRVLDDAADPG